jgi:hypothetical protein
MGDEETDAVLAALLNDEDLAVVKRVAACLLALLASRALERFTGVYAVADNQRGDVMNDELRVAVATHPRLRPALLRLANDGDAGARSALAWFD